MIIQPCGNRRFGLSLLGTGASFFFRDIWALNLGGGTIVFLRPFLAWSPSHQKNQWSVEEGRDSWRCGKRQRMRTACCFSFVSFPNFVLISSESGHADSSLGGLSLAGRVEGIDLGVGRWDGRPDGKGGDAWFSHVCVRARASSAAAKAFCRFGHGRSLLARNSGVNTLRLDDLYRTRGMIRAEKAKLKFVRKMYRWGWPQPQHHDPICNTIVNSSPFQNVLYQE